MKKILTYQTLINIVVIMISFISFFIVLMDVDRPSYFKLLPILPLCFAIINMFFYKLYSKVPENIGLTLVVFLMFFRFSIAPMLMSLGSYNLVIFDNLENNIPKSIFLFIYELIMIYIVFANKMSKDKFYIIKSNHKLKNFKIKDSLKIIIIMLILFVILVFVLVPEFKYLFRTIFGLSDETYTYLVNSDIINTYGVSIYKRALMVIGVYIFRIVRLLFPVILIIEIYNKNKKNVGLVLCLSTIIIQFLIVDETIARSVYYSFIMIMIIAYLYPHYNKKLLIICFAFGAATVFIYFFVRYKTSSYSSLMIYLSKVSDSYFSGINVTSGIFNLPRNISLRSHFFIYDYLKSIPFGNTLFNLETENISSFFNDQNNVYGQIPTTISCGYYYFGFIFAPIYSIIFASIAYTSGKKINLDENIISKLCYLFLSLMMSLGIVMYNIGIIFANIFSVVIPLFIIRRLCYKNEIKGAKNENFV